MTAPIYDVVFREFADTDDYGPGNIVASFENAKNLGWAEYVNDVGEAFFTINQDDPKALGVSQEIIADAGHMEIYRNGEQVFGGWVGETDERAEDAIIYGYSYAAGLYIALTDWNQVWLGSQVNTIVTALWNRANSGLTDQILGFASAGTIQTPVTTSGGATPILHPRYEANYKRILFCLQELVALSRGETTNRVMFEITPGGQFNFWKNKGVDQSTVRWAYGDGRVSGFQRVRLPLERRNVLRVVGSSPRDIVLRKSVEDTTDRNTKGRREEPIFLSWVRDEAEMDRVAARRLVLAKRTETALGLTFKPNSLIPFRATGATFGLTDQVLVEIQRGITNMREHRLVIGQQVIVYRGQEIVRPLLEEKEL